MEESDGKKERDVPDRAYPSGPVEQRHQSMDDETCMRNVREKGADMIDKHERGSWSLANILMCMCVYVYVCVCVCACVRVYVRECVHACM